MYVALYGEAQRSLLRYWPLNHDADVVHVAFSRARVGATSAMLTSHF